jgi:hypothetical protein
MIDDGHISAKNHQKQVHFLGSAQPASIYRNVRPVVSLLVSAD